MVLRLLPASAAFIVAFVLSAGEALATHVQCGDTLTTSATLDSDLTGCPGDGIVIGAPNVTLDLGGHTVSGDGSGGQGIRDYGSNNVVVRNGKIRDFEYGVYFYLVRGSRIEHVDVTGFFGISLDGQPSNNVVAANSVAGGILVGEGFWIGGQTFRPAGNRIEQNIVTPSPSILGESGISLRLVDGNVVSQNLVSGGPVVVGGDAFTHNGADENTVSGNTVVSSRRGYDILLAQDCVGNDVLGNYVFGSFIGIFVTVSCNDNLVQGNRVRSVTTNGIAVSTNDYPTARNVLDANDVAESGADGILVARRATDTVVTRNLSKGNSDDGIQVDHATTHVGQNTANRNGDLGIEAIAGTIDAGGNRAKQNRNHAQCVNVSCSKSGKP